MTEQPDQQLTIDEELETFDDWVRGLPIAGGRSVPVDGDGDQDNEEPEP